MVKSKRLKPVHRVAESREMDAAREMGDSKRFVLEQEQRLEELRRYHSEYLERFHSAAKLGMSAMQLQEYRAFLAKLERAIREQEAIILDGRSAHKLNKDKWQEKHIHTQAIGKVIDRYKSAENQAQDKREQKETDERNQRKPH